MKEMWRCFKVNGNTNTENVSTDWKDGDEQIYLIIASNRVLDRFKRHVDLFLSRQWHILVGEQIGH